MFPKSQITHKAADAVALPSAVVDKGLAFALDLFYFGIVLTDQDARKLFANAAAIDMLDGSGPIRCIDNLLGASTRKATLALRKAIRWAGNGPASEATDVPLTFCDGRPAIARVFLASERYAVGGSYATAAVVITAPQIPPPPIEAMASLYGLTSSEMKVLASILQGRNRDATARHLGLAPSTIKTHLTRIYLKTATASQHELVQLATRLSVPAR